MLLQTGIAVSDRNSIADLERSIGDVLADQISDEAVEIPRDLRRAGLMESS